MDALDRFSAALAAEHDGEVATPGVTRSRILERLAQKHSPRSRLRVVWTIPLFMLGAGTALAASGQLPMVLQPVTHWLQSAEAASGVGVPQKKRPSALASVVPAAPAAPPPAPAPAPAAAPTPDGSTAPEAAAPADSASAPGAGSTLAARAPRTSAAGAASTRLASTPAAPVPAGWAPEVSASDRSFSEVLGPAVPASSERASAGPGSTEPAVSRQAEPAAPDPSLALYTAAHRAHFRSQDYAAAARQYKRYLQSAPSGSFATEARYNLSLCLLRLGRTTEARPILTAFASGTYGSYRQAEATRLLDALPPTPSGK